MIMSRTISSLQSHSVCRTSSSPCLPSHVVAYTIHLAVDNQPEVTEAIKPVLKEDYCYDGTVCHLLTFFASLVLCTSRRRTRSWLSTAPSKSAPSSKTTAGFSSTRTVQARFSVNCGIKGHSKPPVASIRLRLQGNQVRPTPRRDCKRSKLRTQTSGCEVTIRLFRLDVSPPWTRVMGYWASVFASLREWFCDFLRLRVSYKRVPRVWSHDKFERLGSSWT